MNGSLRHILLPAVHDSHKVFRVFISIRLKKKDDCFQKSSIRLK